MEDDVDRVYVPGTNPTSPARDVEPFWPPEELDAPVHGGRPVPHDAPPARPVPTPRADPGSNVYRPADRTVVPPPPPPPGPAPAQRMPPPARAADPPPTQAWPNIPQRVPAGLGSEPAEPVSGAETDEQAGAGVAADSPWAQPPQRPVAAPAAAPATPPQRPTAVAPRTNPAAAGAPRQSPPPLPEGDGPMGAVYRPGPVTAAGDAARNSPAPAQPGPGPRSVPPAGPAAAAEPGAAVQSAPPARPTPAASALPGPAPRSGAPAGHPASPPPGPAPQPGVPQRPAPTPDPYAAHHPSPHQGAPARQPRPAQQGAADPARQPSPHPRVVDQSAPAPGPHAAQRPGPYPPTVDPRAMQPHPQLSQAAQGGPRPDEPPPADPYQQVPWVSDGTPTAEEFARRRLAKPAEPTATMGARALVTKGTMGLVRLAPGRYEREYKQDVDMVRRNFGGLRQVTVVNPKGGAGKTVAVLLLAMTFGQKRGGYVLAWDNNETQGTLGMRAQQDFHARTVRDMMRDLHLFRGAHGRVGDLSQYVRAQGEGMFDVLASDESATAGEMLTAGAFAEIREIVSRFYKLIFVDTGNNVRAQNWQAAMDATDQLVITMSARNDSAETAARMLDHLEQSGRQRLVRQAVTVVTMPPTRKDIDLPAIQRHFAARTRAVLLAPYEKLIDSGEPLRYGALSNGTRDSWLKIAAAVAEGL